MQARGAWVLAMVLLLVGTVGGAADLKTEIVGKWEEIDSVGSMTFLPEGRVVIVPVQRSGSLTVRTIRGADGKPQELRRRTTTIRPGIPQEREYEIVDENHIKLLPFGVVPAEVLEVTIRDGVLTITRKAGLPQTYKRLPEDRKVAPPDSPNPRKRRVTL